MKHWFLSVISYTLSLFCLSIGLLIHAYTESSVIDMMSQILIGIGVVTVALCFILYKNTALLPEEEETL